MNHLLFVVGPTACGKSDFAVHLAQAMARETPLEIINCDSVQFFSGVDIGAAKPTPEQLALVRHHLIGHVPLGAAYTAGDFRRDALKVIDERSQLGASDFLAVGGSGFYVQALEKGMFDVPEIPEGLRAKIEEESRSRGFAALYEELRERDPETAAKIQPADRYRILRALEILRAHPQRTLSSMRAEFEKQREPAPFRVSKIGVYRDRDVLRKRVEERTRAMLKQGLIEEVESLRAQGLSGWSPMKSVGYKEVQECLDGRLARSDLESAITTSTLQLAKRQMTWFKRDAEIQWFDAEKGWEPALTFARMTLVTKQN